MTTTEMWAVFDSEGNIISRAINECAAQLFATSNCQVEKFEELERIGYTCRRVKVTIEEIKSDENKFEVSTRKNWIA